MSTGTTFFSYSRTDSDFALRLANDLRNAGVDIWIDQLDIAAGNRWDNSVDDALKASANLLLVLSPSSVDSHNVMDEVSFALENGKRVIPVLYQECSPIFRLRRLQHIDFAGDYPTAFAILLKAFQNPVNFKTGITDNVNEEKSTSATYRGNKDGLILDRQRQAETLFKKKEYNKAWMEVRYVLYFQPDNAEASILEKKTSEQIDRIDKGKTNIYKIWRWIFILLGIGILIYILGNYSFGSTTTKIVLIVSYIAWSLIYELALKKPETALDRTVARARYSDRYFREVEGFYNLRYTDSFEEYFIKMHLYTILRSRPDKDFDFVTAERFAIGFNYAVKLKLTNKIKMAKAKKVVNYLEEGGQMGGPNCLYALGQVYQKGLLNEAKNNSYAKTYFEKAIKNGNSDAIYSLGLAYAENSSATSQDLEIAQQLYNKACKMGIKEACEKLKASTA